MWHVKGRSDLKESFYSLLAEKLQQIEIPETTIELSEERIKKERRDLLTVESMGLSALAKIYCHVVGKDLHILLIMMPAGPQLNIFQYSDSAAFMITCVEAINEIVESKPWKR
jgi:hypothetical protein